MTYKTQGVCSQKIDFDIVDNKVTNVRFLGGCNGNTQGVAKLCEGRNAKEVLQMFVLHKSYKLHGLVCLFILESSSITARIFVTHSDDL